MFGRKFRTPKAKKRARIQRVLMWTTTLVGIALSVSAIAWMMQRPWMRISAIEIVGANTIDADRVRAHTSSLMSGRIVGLIPRDNALMVSNDRIASALSAHFPRARAITVEREGFTAMRIVIQERNPESLWCGDIVPATPELRKLGSCYFVDPTGYLFARAPGFSGTPMPRFYAALDHGKEIGQFMVQTEEYRSFYELWGSFAAHDIPIAALLIVDAQEYEVYLESGTRVIATRDQKAEEVIENLRAVLSSEALAADMSELEYIDLRFGNKVYYRARTATEASQRQHAQLATTTNATTTQ